MSQSDKRAVTKAVNADIARRRRAVERLHQGVDLAIDTLLDVAANADKPADRVRAAAEILDRAGIVADKAPSTSINVNFSAEHLAALRDLSDQVGPVIDHKPLKSLAFSTGADKGDIKQVGLDDLAALVNENPPVPEDPPGG